MTTDNTPAEAPAPDIVERLRERPFRRASETEDQARERRQREREEAAVTITRLTAENERLRDLLNRANLTRDEEAVVLKLGTLETANAMLTAEVERMRAELQMTEVAMAHVRGQMLHPDQLLDEAIERARAALQEPPA